MTLFYTYCILIGTLILLETCNFIDMPMDNTYSYINNIPVKKNLMYWLYVIEVLWEKLVLNFATSNHTKGC